MIATRTIPSSREEVTTLAGLALTAALAIEDEVGLEQNTAPKISTDLYDYAGNPGAGTVGKRHLFDEARSMVNAAQAARRVTLADGRRYCTKAVDALKGYLGRSWNPAWVAIGFSRTSLEVPYEPMALLLGIRDYFRAHAAHENAAQGVTAAQADAAITAIQTASQNVLEKQQARAMASQAQKAALAQLRKRLTGLRTELDLLLADDDPRWRRFGFSRPIDQRLPEEVAGLTLAQGLSGQVVATWNASARALDYRVTYAIDGGSSEPVQLPLIAALTVTIPGLAPGATVIVNVTARNSAGDTLPTEARIVVA